MVPDEQFGSPGRGTGTALEQGDQRLAAVVCGIEGGQVGNLQGTSTSPVPAAMKSTRWEPVVWLRVKPRVNTDEPASENAWVGPDPSMPQLIRVNPRTATTSQLPSSTTRATGSLMAKIRSMPM